MDRRTFLGCGAWAAAALAFGPPARRLVAGEPAADLVLAKDFARVQKIGDGLWSVVSTPMRDGKFLATTVSNGGLVAGKEGVLAIEGFNTPEGAAWLSDLSLELTGRRPTHVVLTHFHPDHSGGLAGYPRGAEAPAIVATKETRRLLLEKLHKDPPAGEGDLAKAGTRLLLPDTILVDPSKPVTIDLGGRKARLVPRGGHTPSDLTVEVDAPRTIFTGDLFFNGLFPYYGDAIPSRLAETVAAIRKEDHAVYVPGHGPLADTAQLAPYAALLEDVGAAARKAVGNGTPAEEAWKSYVIPESLGAWALFRPDVARFAFEAWERELKGA
ncbi:MAG: MBL fold metallo-hydrolase [Planctomycetes bacterium]|nr:MBL fold metallo-hydrolase [Planctomycetota bacterium]